MTLATILLTVMEQEISKYVNVGIACESAHDNCVLGSVTYRTLTSMAPLNGLTLHYKKKTVSMWTSVVGLFQKEEEFPPSFCTVSV